MTTIPNPQTEAPTEDVIYCERRNCPGSTGLRCYQTGVPICIQCAVRTPVGYISKDAAKQRADRFYNIQFYDYIIAAVIGFFGMLILGLPVMILLGGFGLFLFFIGAIIGGLLGGAIGEAIFRVTGRRRGRYTERVVGGAMILACLVLFLITQNIFAVGIIGFFTISTAIARIRVAL